jgi:acyl carrier protein
VLADVDGLQVSWQVLAGVAGCGEPEVAVRAGRVLGRRLVRAVPPREGAAGAGGWWRGAGAAGPAGPAGVAGSAGVAGGRAGGAGTVLVTGVPGVLGGVVAGYLAGSGRAGRLVLVSRRGPGAAGVAGLAAGLAGAGVQVLVAACDVADRGQLAGLVGQVPAAYPLTAVVHAAGVVDDGVVTALTPGRVDRVLAPKADAAVFLDELTAGAGLAAFVLFSSAAATFGAPGQGNYAAANAVLDALACQRRARGLPAVSIAWGMWEQATGLTAHLGEAGRARARGAVLPLTTVQGLELLEAALGLDVPVAVAVNVDLGGLRAQARAGALPPLWRALVRAPAAGQAPVPGGTLAGRLAGLPEAGQLELVLDLVRAQAAAVLGHASADPVRSRAAFRDLGFDSLTSIELRNRLAEVTGLRLPATLVFDRPTPQALAEWLREAITRDGTALTLATPILTELNRLDTMLSTTEVEDAASDRIAARLEAILSKWKAARKREEDGDVVKQKLESATDDEVFGFIEENLGIS